MTFSKDFESTYINSDTEIRNKLDSARLRQINENRARLVPIIESIIFLGRQNIPLRGHRDDGLIDSSSSSSIVNEGNFRELLRFRISAGDTALQKHLENTSANATYISKTTQSEIIEVCKEEIFDILKTKINSSTYYSVIFDETTDASHTSQMSLIIRYLDESILREDFLEFINCHKENYDKENNNKEPVMSGEVLAKTVINTLSKHGFNLENCVGIGTDGCNLYRGSVNAVGTIKEVVAFFNASAKRKIVLKSCNTSLINLCETRWSERHDSINRFKSELISVVEALEVVSEWNDRESASKADSLISGLTNPTFILSLFSLDDVLSETHTLSQALQTKALDKMTANNLIKDLIHSMTKKREEADKNFNDIYEDALNVMKELNITMYLPRSWSPKKSSQYLNQ
ncbi:hypothetical protein JTE90_016947 [Oedothorax gibbosus]|uniref:DUF4371 domain-containing protein n=1 Tax=Oedothorax gibbosus TaxID=931172 RepID=A0AAV6UUT0_9ARAC|nr:hypothetical protein JTE90_016947 [Oedothorax gibbosus]